MPQTIHVVGEGLVEFPDGMSDNDIAGAIKRHLNQKQQKALFSDIPEQQYLASQAKITQPQLNTSGGTAGIAASRTEPLLPSIADVKNQLPDAETRGQLMQDVSRSPIPATNFEVTKDDSIVKASAKTAANLLSSIPSFAASPLGVASAATGNVFPRIISGLFAADAGKHVVTKANEITDKWNTLTPGQKAAAGIDVTGNTLMALLLGHGAVKGFKNPSLVPPKASGNGFGVPIGETKAGAALDKLVIQPKTTPSESVPPPTIRAQPQANQEPSGSPQTPTEGESKTGVSGNETAPVIGNVKGKTGENQVQESVGPGAAAAGEPGTYRPIREMSDRLATTYDPKAPINEQINAIEKAKGAVQSVKDVVARSAASVKAISDAVWKKYTGLPEYGDEQRSVGKWNYAIQRSDHEAQQFSKQILREVPSKVRREAITNWIQAEGNLDTLKSRAAASKGDLRKGYEIAQNLTSREKEIAEMISRYYDQQLERGIQSGILKDGLDNYITQVWKRENPVTKKLQSDIAYGKLTPNFKYAKKRIFDSFFEGEQAGYQPMKDAGYLVSHYDQSFNRSLAARAFIKDLHDGKASDGRPLVEVVSEGKLIGPKEKPAVLIQPHAKPEELGDYRTIDHPAMRGWAWAAKAPDGTPIFVKGDMLVHPEAFVKLKNRLSTSGFANHPVGRALKTVQSGIKQNLMSLSAFHQVQEGIHALSHKVNPTSLPELDFENPVTRGLVEHGLQLADYRAAADFGEGLSGGGLATKLPYVGTKLHAYNEWLFQDYIPRLKLQMARLALERNRARYPNMNPDKLQEMTASQANAAFGELPYRYWGRNPTLQDALRTFLLAPDFLEARARFVGGALKPFGREQMMALGALAATQYITARIANQVMNKDAHWELKNAFKIVIGNHAYGVRTIPGDVLHLVSDPRSFTFNRISPLSRTGLEAMTGRDDRGLKRDIVEQTKDLVSMPVPISLKSRLGQKWWEYFVNSLGVQEQRYDTQQTIAQKAQDWKAKNGIKSPVDIVYNADEDKYAALKLALRDGDQEAAQAQFNKLKQTTSAAKIHKHFKESLNRPWTGSKAADAKFFSTLDDGGKQEFKNAQEAKQKELSLVMKLK